MIINCHMLFHFKMCSSKIHSLFYISIKVDDLVVVA